ncbi:uncharacterized protein LOC132295992 [Cornus florida]|uniref:uncharacterized protein LOC132295992 n=1 Tax=Cornus florida TaxID=4283 RepID=UPI00289FF778|nr:uncharacterized protein LOC132295992 [Cornus florida]
MSNSYSMWPVVLMVYNLPPYKCMKDPYFIMSLLIPGPKSLGNEIDVYLQPLIDDLKELWEEVLWTINDFPAFAVLSGWMTKGKLACPVCNKETSFFSLKNGKKICYMCHRRFLPRDHSWRKNKQAFDGNQDHRQKPKELSGDDLLEQLNKVNVVTFGKGPNSLKRKCKDYELNWTKKSIFFELPYWRTLKLRHNLDVMHIEKNICESVIGTLLDIDGKTKDTIKARMDLKETGIKKELHLISDGDKFMMPRACYQLSSTDKKEFYEWLKSIKFLDGYASNISRCVNVRDRKLSGMKSHDCHVLLQRLLPVAIRKHLCKDVCIALTELSLFFKKLCSRALLVDDLEQMEKDIVIILCKLERIFPPAFFDVMVNLTIHLPREAILGGPVPFRWMYPIERFLFTLKKTVRNTARPEGSIAEAYIDKECLIFCSMYLEGIETRFNRDERNDDGGQGNRREGLYVFTQDMKRLHEQKAPEATDQLYFLACGPKSLVIRYSGCIVNGIRFRTIDCDKHRRTQNSGVVVKGEHDSKEIDFYDVLVDVMVLNYLGENKVHLFKCDWFNVGNQRMGIHSDGNITSVAPRNLYEVEEMSSVDEDTDVDDDSYEVEDAGDIDTTVQYDDLDLDTLHREDVQLVYVDLPNISPNNATFDQINDDFIADDESSDEDDTLIDYCDDEEDDELQSSENDEEDE